MRIARYWQNVLPIFETEHVKVFAPDLPMGHLPRAERAKYLHDFIQQNFPNQRFHIIAHSLTGVDARYLLSHYDEKNVISLTTIASPHHGTPIADFFQTALQQKNFWFYFARALNFHLEKLGFLAECSLPAMEKFNRENPNRAGIHYFSVVAQADPWWWQMSPVLWPFSFFTRRGTEANDGIIPLSSQPWGEVVAVTNLDHLGQLNFHWFRYPQEDRSRAMYKTIFARLETLETDAKRTTQLTQSHNRK